MLVRITSLMFLFTISYIAQAQSEIKTNINQATFKDIRDGQVYKLIEIGDQTWMAQNLNYYTNEGSCCLGNDESMCKIFGRLYVWEKAKDVCPPGWHLSDNSEWNILEQHLMGWPAVQMRDNGSSLWRSNTSGFSALPGSKRYESGYFEGGSGVNAYFWTSTMDQSGYPIARVINWLHDQSEIVTQSESTACSVRCIKDK